MYIFIETIIYFYIDRMIIVKVKVDLVDELMSRFKVLGCSFDKGSNNYYIVRSFLNINLTKLLGTYLLDEDDYELLTTRERLEVTSTFYKDMIFFIIDCRDGIITITALNAVTDEELFSIRIYGNVADNIYHDYGNFVEHSYEINTLMGENYRYCLEEVDGDKRNILFSGTFYSLNAKYKDKDIFAYSKSYPVSKSPKNLMGKIKEVIVGEGYVYIPTSIYSLETLEYADVIFRRLEGEADKELTKGVPSNVKLEKKS